MLSGCVMGEMLAIIATDYERRFSPVDELQ